MGDCVRIGVLGGGGILGAHAPGLKAQADAGRCDVVAVAEPNEDRYPWIREMFGDVAFYADYADLLAEADVDAVDIILPHNLHMPAAVAAAESGRHVLVEKVMARNIWECDRMIEAAAAAGVTLTVCHDRRYNGEWMALKEIVDSGALGEILFWKLDHNQDVNPSGGSIAWAATRDGIGGGAIMSCLTHQIDGLRWYGGQVESVTCMTVTRPERMEGEILGVVLAKMQSGAMAELSINWWTRANQPPNALWYEMVHVCGTGGEAYRMTEKGGTFVRLHDASNAAAVERYGREALDGYVKVDFGPWGGHQRCIEEWVKLLRGEPADIKTDGRECRGTVEVAEAAYRSAATGHTQSLPIDAKPWPSF